MSDFFKPGADEVIVPTDINLSNLGWAPTDPIDQALAKERRGMERLAADMPVAFAARDATPLVPEIEAKWNEFQVSKGRQAGSFDMTLLEDFAFGKNLAWLPQKIGSCVASNTFRGWVKRAVFQIILAGQSGEYLGRDEYGAQSIAFYVAWTYGMARKRANMRGGDGLYCEPMGESLLKDGVLPCHSPKLLALLKTLGADGEKDFPEPQSNAIYRAFGDWKYIDDLASDACCRLLDTDHVTTADQYLDFAKAYKPAFQCSGIAVKKVGTHKDGFAIHAQDQGNSWAHNMGVHGFFVASDGAIFIRISNESWGDEIVYNIPIEEYDRWMKKQLTSTMTIGEIDLNKSTPQS